MTKPDAEAALEAQIAEWRSFVLKRRGVSEADADELESHLRDQADDLRARGLAGDEAFLVAVKRLGAQDDLSREFARVHSGRLWKQLVLTGADQPGGSRGGAISRTEVWVVVGLAVLAAAAYKIPAAVGVSVHDDPAVYFRNLPLFSLPFLAAYFGWKRRLSAVAVGVLVAVFAAGGALINAYPFAEGAQTEVLAALHLPIVLWLTVGLAYVGGEWRSHAKRMDFIRFTGEWVVYMSLIALGGGILSGITVQVFGVFNANAFSFVDEWLAPGGAMGATVVAAWLVESKQGVIENIAPVLTRVFTPLFAAVLVAVVATVPFTWTGEPIDRNSLIILDVLLVLVLGLVLYAISARDGADPAGWFDRIQLATVAAAVLVDAFVLAEILGRIAEYGFTANRTAVLGENLVLLANLVWAARLSLGFLRGRRPLADAERWQTAYAPVYLVWAVAVVVAFPPLFSFA